MTGVGAMNDERKSDRTIPTFPYVSRGATCHVARSTCHRVNPYENKRWGKIFEGDIAETPNMQGKCALV